MEHRIKNSAVIDAVIGLNILNFIMMIYTILSVVIPYWDVHSAAVVSSIILIAITKWVNTVFINGTNPEPQ